MSVEHALRTFKTREPRRDAEVDEQRISSLEKSIDAVVRKIGAERVGILNRLKQTLNEADAATPRRFGPSPRLSNAEYLRVETRLRLLDLQVLKCAEVRAMVSGLRSLAEGK